MERYRLKFFGAFGFFNPAGARITVTSRKSIALLALLAMADDGERRRAWLQDCLWGSRGAKQAQSSLRRELTNLRKLLPADQKLLAFEFDKVIIDLDAVDVDARGAIAARPNGQRFVPSDFLEGLDIPDADGFNDWLIAQRAALADADAAAPAPAQRNRHEMQLRPSLAVLPFDDISANGGNRAIADGVSDEIHVTLSRFSTLFVVWAGREAARNFDIQSKKDVRALCAELEVRYLLTGAIQADGDRIRVTARLTDGEGDAPVWTDRFEDRIDNVFSLQDRIANIVAPQIDSSVEKNERRRATSAPVKTADAWQLYWRANARFRTWTRDGMLEAISLAEELLQLEPGNAWAAALASFCHATVASSRWLDDTEASRKASLDFYERALRAGPEDPFVLGYCAAAQVLLPGDMTAADTLITRALAIHPNSAATLFWGAWTDIALGKIDRARERFALATRLNPRSAVRPFIMTGEGLCHLAENRHEEAIKCFDEAAQFVPTYPASLGGLLIAKAEVGADAAAHELAQRLFRMGGVDTVLPFFTEPHKKTLARYLDGAAIK